LFSLFTRSVFNLKLSYFFPNSNTLYESLLRGKINGGTSAPPLPTIKLLRKLTYL